jgi:transcriptional regulator GlxA family with amidase domain
VTRTIDVLAYPGVQLLDVAGPLQVFASANTFAAAKGHPPPYVPRVIALHSPIATSSGLELIAQPLPAPSQPVDTLIVPGGEGVDVALADTELVQWIRARAGAARRTVSVCTGAFVLAQAGLLDGRTATTHWARCSELAARFPAINVQAKPIFVHDGAVWSSAGVTAGIDLCLALVEEDMAREIALEIARDLVMFLKRPGDQAQYSATLALQRPRRFDALHAWVLDNLRGDLTVASLAARCGMSERSFIRHYSLEQGVTPARAVERMRIETAKRMLAETDAPLKLIAMQSGFESEDVFRRCFMRSLSISPRDYRRNWQANMQDVSG